MRREDFWEQRLLMAAYKRSKKNGWKSDLTIQDIVIPEYCPYLGVKLTRLLGTSRGAGNPFNPSIDRIDSSKGYVKGNIQIISVKANRMKSDATPQELVVFAMNIIKNHIK